MWAFSLVATHRGYSLVVVHRLPVAVASHVLESGCACELSSCGSWALAHRLNGFGAWA